MIFGFNTDIAAEGTVYHVQTEVREHGPRLESQIFVRGQCIGKRCGVVPDGAVEEEMQELARAQHRWIVEAVRGGFLQDVLTQEAPSAEPPAGLPQAAETSQPVAGAQEPGMLGPMNWESLSQDLLADEPGKPVSDALTVEFLGSRRISLEEAILRFRVLSGGEAADEAEISAKWKHDSATGAGESAISNESGVAEMRLALPEGEAELEVKVQRRGMESARRFLVKSAKVQRPPQLQS
jgi:hypothetical protein